VLDSEEEDEIRSILSASSSELDEIDIDNLGSDSDDEEQ
jgi:hypothetical protein